MTNKSTRTAFASFAVPSPRHGFMDCLSAPGLLHIPWRQSVRAKRCELTIFVLTRFPERKPWSPARFSDEFVATRLQVLKTSAMQSLEAQRFQEFQWLVSISSELDGAPIKEFLENGSNFSLDLLVQDVMKAPHRFSPEIWLAKRAPTGLSGWTMTIFCTQNFWSASWLCLKTLGPWSVFQKESSSTLAGRQLALGIG